MWNDILDDPKVANMRPKTFKIFTFLLAFCSELDQNGTISLTKNDPKWRLRLRKRDLDSALDELNSLKIIDIQDDEIHILNWDKRQFKSDTSAERVRNYRERHSNDNVTLQKRKSNAVDTETDTETEKKNNEKNDEKINENAKSVIELFNKIAGKNCLPVEANLKPIRGRIREGITGKQFAFVIKNKTLQWKNTDMEKYLHPTTLFGSKFDKYVNENPARDKNPDWVPI